ncbi:MAG: hypothetical protein HC933_00255 [Pleurocapsa sp. SU_196_0]|nr:hypothetical protein [Pleurocapsa sp. SU_196_0]
MRLILGDPMSGCRERSVMEIGLLLSLLLVVGVVLAGLWYVVVRGKAGYKALTKPPAVVLPEDELPGRQEHSS